MREITGDGRMTECLPMIDGALQVRRIPQNNRRHDPIQTIED